MKRQIQGGRQPPNSKTHQTHPPTAASRKTTQTEDSKKQVSESENAKPKSALARLKAMMKVSTLFSSESKTNGQPPAVHPPWSKARIGPMEKENASKEKSGVGRGSERAEDEVGGQWGTRDEVTEGGIGRGYRRGAANNGLRNGFTGGVGAQPENGKMELPRFPSSSWSGSVNGAILIDGNYFQTLNEASKPVPTKQKLSEALSLISLSRRLQGATVAADWDTGQELYGSIGDRSISASISSASLEERIKHWERKQGAGNGLSEEWWKKEERLHKTAQQSDTESKESPSEFSDTSSPSSSTVANKEEGESSRDSEEDSLSKTETDSDIEKEQDTPDTTEDSGSEDVESSEIGSDSETERTESSRKSSNGSSGRSSKSAKSKERDSASRGSYSRPKTSRHHSHSTTEVNDGQSEESDEEEESPKSSSSRRKSDDLSPIMEDSEEEDSSS